MSEAVIKYDNGLMLLIDKPKDYSSAKIVNIVKKRLNVRKAGHSGTLDPNASGLMIICTDKMTKSLNSLLTYSKEYEGIMVLGKSTSSFDGETEVVKEESIKHLSNEQIIGEAKNFEGEIKQIPPMYSAIKFKGKPLYKYARKHQEVERQPRSVYIKSFEINNIQLPEVSFRVECSKGTYIRALVNDFGNKLGVGAYLKELRRLKIGEYDVKDSIKLDDFLSIYPRIN
jgi:tRNA pseudouridine55 synthase